MPRRAASRSALIVTWCPQVYGVHMPTGARNDLQTHSFVDLSFTRLPLKCFGYPDGYLSRLVTAGLTHMSLRRQLARSELLGLDWLG